MSVVLRRSVSVLSALLAGACGGESPAPTEGPTARNPLVIESPHIHVVSGADTTEVFAPTVFAYFADPEADVEPTRASGEAAQAFQAVLSQLAPHLDAMGVRLVAVGAPPAVEEVAPEVDARAGPRLAPGGAGFLLVHPRGALRRLDRSAGASDVLCAAARLFETAPPARVGITCP